MNHLKSLRLSSGRLSALLLACSLAACAEAGDGADLPEDDAGEPYYPPASGWDAGAQPSPGVTPTPSPTGTPGTFMPPPPMSGQLVDGGLDITSLLSGLGGGDGGGAGTVTGDPGKGELDPNGAINTKLPPKADNPKECPSLAPPNPVGGCLGLPIYLLCGYGTEGGPQYSCTCDWYHWLCI